MKFEQKYPGILLTPIPEPKEPELPSRKYGILEIQDDERRTIAKDAMMMLWDAMDLTRGSGGIRLPDRPGPEVNEVHSKMYRLIGEMLLGEDCPEGEVWT